MERIEDVATGSSTSEQSLEQDLKITESNYKGYGFLWLKWITQNTIEVDMLVFYIKSEDLNVDGLMDVHLASCRSEVLNASQERMPLVNEKLREVIDDALTSMEEWPHADGIANLRKILVISGEKKMKELLIKG